MATLVVSTEPNNKSSSGLSSISKVSCIGGKIRPSNSSKNEYLLMGILTFTCFLFDVKARRDAKPKF